MAPPHSVAVPSGRAMRCPRTTTGLPSGVAERGGDEEGRRARAAGVREAGLAGVAAAVSGVAEDGIDRRGRRRPGRAVVIVVAAPQEEHAKAAKTLLAMAGIPLTSGFTGKWAVFAAALSAGAWPVVVVGVLVSAVAAFFYVKVIVVMFFSEPIGEGPSVTTPSALTGTVILVGVAATLLLGIVPGALIDVLGGRGSIHQVKSALALPILDPELESRLRHADG